MYVHVDLTDTISSWAILCFENCNPTRRNMKVFGSGWQRKQGVGLL